MLLLLSAQSDTAWTPENVFILLFILIGFMVMMYFLWGPPAQRKRERREQLARKLEATAQRLKTSAPTMTLGEAFQKDMNTLPERLPAIKELITAVVPLVDAWNFRKDPEAAIKKQQQRNEYDNATQATREGISYKDRPNLQAKKAETEYLIRAGVTEVTQMFEMQNTILAEIEKNELLLKTKLSDDRRELVEQTVEVLKAQYERVREQTVSEIERNTP